MIKTRKTVGFIFWDNSKTYHGDKLHQSDLISIVDAYDEFEKLTGKNPLKISTITCQPLFNPPWE